MKLGLGLSIANQIRIPESGPIANQIRIPESGSGSGSGSDYGGIGISLLDQFESTI